MGLYENRMNMQCVPSFKCHAIGMFSQCSMGYIVWPHCVVEVQSRGTQKPAAKRYQSNGPTVGWEGENLVHASKPNVLYRIACMYIWLAHGSHHSVFRDVAHTHCTHMSENEIH